MGSCSAAVVDTVEGILVAGILVVGILVAGNPEEDILEELHRPVQFNQFHRIKPQTLHSHYKTVTW